MSELGFHCMAVSGTAEGVEVCGDRTPDVVVMEASQFDDARHFLGLAATSRGSQPVVLVYSDTVDFETMGETILDGAAEFLLKPFDRDLLRFKLRQSGVLAGTSPH